LLQEAAVDCEGRSTDADGADEASWPEVGEECGALIILAVTSPLEEEEGEEGEVAEGE
jgi:hypothetical protein